MENPRGRAEISTLKSVSQKIKQLKQIKAPLNPDGNFSVTSSTVHAGTGGHYYFYDTQTSTYNNY